MTNIDLITKLMQGDNAQEVEIPVNNDETVCFTMRPLTDGEIKKLHEMESKPYNVQINQTEKRTTNKGEVNNSELVRAQTKTKYQAVAWSLSIEGQSKVKPEHIEKLPKGIPSVLFEKVIEISELTEEDLDLLKRFR